MSTNVCKKHQNKVYRRLCSDNIVKQLFPNFMIFLYFNESFWRVDECLLWFYIRIMRKVVFILMVTVGFAIADYHSFIHLNDKIYRCYIGRGMSYGRLESTDLQTGEFQRHWCAELGVTYTKDGISYSCGGFTANGDFVEFEMASTKIEYKGKTYNYNIYVEDCFKQIDKDKIDPCKKK